MFQKILRKLKIYVCVHKYMFMQKLSNMKFRHIEIFLRTYKTNLTRASDLYINIKINFSRK